jgi:putative endonuclease
VTPAKAARIRRLAAAWLAVHRVRWCEIRFDVIAVVIPPEGTGGATSVEHLQGAF